MTFWRNLETAMLHPPVLSIENPSWNALMWPFAQSLMDSPMSLCSPGSQRVKMSFSSLEIFLNRPHYLREQS